MIARTLTSRSLAPLALAALVALAGPAARALSYGTNITVSDNNYAGTGWYSNREDQETETNPGTITGQVWDLEGMFLNGTQLTLVGGFDFKNGQLYGGHTYKSGDIFIDVNGDAKYGSLGSISNVGSGATAYGSGPHTLVTNNTFGWDYVIDLNFTNNTYNVYSLTALSKVTRVMDVETSNPWQYASGGSAVAGFQGKSLTYISGLTNAGTGFGGDSTNNTGYSTGSNAHYALQVDLGFIAGSDATIHYTMECGNDNLVGKAHVPDSGASLLLVSLGLAAVAGLRRSRR